MVSHALGACRIRVTSEAVKRPDHIICCAESDVKFLRIRSRQGSRCVKIDEAIGEDRGGSG